MLRRYKGLCLLIVAFSVLSSCAGGSIDNESPGAINTTAARHNIPPKGNISTVASTRHADAERQWRALNLSSYSFYIEKQCYCTADARRLMRVDVRRSQIKNIYYADSGEKVADEIAKDVRNIEQWFDFIAKKQAAHKLDVTYDPQFGYPLLIDMDYHPRMADDELRVEISLVIN